jgi:hypothetical protein
MLGWQAVLRIQGAGRGVESRALGYTPGAKVFHRHSHQSFLLPVMTLRGEVR